MAMIFKNLVEEVAKVLHSYDGGLDFEDFSEIFGRVRPSWEETDITKKAGVKEYLEEHERDEFRYQAEQVLYRLLDLGALQIEKKE